MSYYAWVWHLTKTYGVRAFLIVVGVLIWLGVLLIIPGGAWTILWVAWIIAPVAIAFSVVYWHDEVRDKSGGLG